MNDFKSLQNKITSLGGVQNNPLCDSDSSSEGFEHLLTDFEAMFESELPTSYKYLYKKYGPFSFKKKLR